MDNLATPQMKFEEMIDTLKGLVFGTFDRTTTKERVALDMAISLLENLCEDAISRQAAIETVDFYKQQTDGIFRINESIAKLPPVTLAKDINVTTTDAISRHTILAEIRKVYFSEEWREYRINYGSNGTRDYLISFIENMPPVQPELNCKNCVFRMGYGTGIDEGVLNALPKKMKEGE